MKPWTPRALYEAKPWLLVGGGAGLAIGMMAWSMSAGFWSIGRSLLCLAGVGLTVVGGITLQLRQDYRARSKWRRERPR